MTISITLFKDFRTLQNTRNTNDLPFTIQDLNKILFGEDATIMLSRFNKFWNNKIVTGFPLVNPGFFKMF